MMIKNTPIWMWIETAESACVTVFNLFCHVDHSRGWTQNILSSGAAGAQVQELLPLGSIRFPESDKMVCISVSPWSSCWLKECPSGQWNSQWPQLERDGGGGGGGVQPGLHCAQMFSSVCSLSEKLQVNDGAQNGQLH